MAPRAAANTVFGVIVRSSGRMTTTPTQNATSMITNRISASRAAKPIACTSQRGRRPGAAVH